MIHPRSVAIALALLLIWEALCRFGVIDRFALIPPSDLTIAMVASSSADWMD